MEHKTEHQTEHEAAIGLFVLVVAYLIGGAPAVGAVSIAYLATRAIEIIIEIAEIKSNHHIQGDIK